MPEVQCSYTHYNGWKACDWHEAWNNRGCCQVRFAALTGILVDDPFLKARTKRYFKEWLTYAVFPDGIDQEYKRWTDYKNTTSHGWSYASVKIGSLVTIADAFARTGDFELYEFSTSDGVYGTKGGPKSLRKVVTVHTSFVDNTIKYYATDKASDVGDPRYLIDAEEELTGAKRNGDIYAAPMANIYYRDSFLKDRYTRVAPGAPPYPANPSTGGWDAWTGEWGIYPGVLFMFGQMEDKVWPYVARLGPTSQRIKGVRR